MFDIEEYLELPVMHALVETVEMHLINKVECSL